MNPTDSLIDKLIALRRDGDIPTDRLIGIEQCIEVVELHMKASTHNAEMQFAKDYRNMGDAALKDASLRDAKTSEKLFTEGEKLGCAKDGAESCKDMPQQETSLSSPEPVRCEISYNNIRSIIDHACISNGKGGFDVDLDSAARGVIAYYLRTTEAVITDKQQAIDRITRNIMSGLADDNNVDIKIPIDCAGIAEKVYAGLISGQHIRTTEPDDIKVANDRVCIGGKWFYEATEPVMNVDAATALSKAILEAHAKWQAEYQGVSHG